LRESEAYAREKWLTLKMYYSFRDTFSFNAPHFESFDGCIVSTSAHILTAYEFHSFDYL